jgi:hypothetical protein
MCLDARFLEKSWAALVLITQSNRLLRYGDGQRDKRDMVRVRPISHHVFQGDRGTTASRGLLDLWLPVG